MANEVYEKAAPMYTDEPEFKKFLERAAEDEAWHYHVMGSASKYLESEPEITPAISVDDETDSRISNYFMNMLAGLEQDRMPREQLIEKILKAELSEWNDIFLYVVSVLKKKTSEFKYPAAKIQAHIRFIENFLEKRESGVEVLNKIKKLPPIWVENILIVDDEKMITEIYKAVLNRSGNIDIAHNGREAMALIEKKFYKLIISDIDMPVMDGFSLFRAAVKVFPEVKKRFLFMTGNLSCERHSFFSENSVSCLQKPVEITVLRKEAEKILQSG